MHLLQITLAVLPLGSCLCLSTTPTIWADTNRDGIVNASDESRKQFWTPERGAIFLPNVGDTFMRCPSQDLAGNPLSNHELASCHDASGHLLLQPGLAAPLVTVPMNVSDSAFAYIYATPDAAYDRVRIFVNDFPSAANETNAWRLVDKEFSFNATQIRAGITLGMDGRQFVTNASAWDGKVTVQFDVHDDNTMASDAVALKIAPILTHHHLQKVETIVATGANDTDPIQQGFVNGMEAGRVAAGITNPLYLFTQSDDIWAQDFFEPAYASMPGPNGPISIRVMLRSAQSTRTGGRQVFEQLRGPGIGGFQPEGGERYFGHLEINSYGNLETIPPYTSKAGIKYPAGRIIQGKHFEKRTASAMSTFLDSQGLQKPLILETGWLLIGHVDEFVQFVPSNKTGLGFTIAIADTVSAINVLNNVAATGNGGVRAISFNGSLDNTFLVTEEELKTTVDETLANATFIAVNAYAQKYIDLNLVTLLSEIPIQPEDVIKIPVLFKDLNLDASGFNTRADGLPSHTDTVMSDEHLVVAFSPAAINGVVIGKTYLCPKPWGPVVDGKDALETAVRDAYAQAGMELVMVDDFLSHHVGLGEVHCGSNTLRETNVVWWE